MKVEDLDRDLPLLLLPVRLETRFFRKPNGNWELRVRVYPDDIHVDSHEPELTGSEVQWGQHFWEQVWKGGNQESRTNAAWRQLVERFGGPRAAWIATTLMPVGFDPKLLTQPFKPTTTSPQFPKVDRRGSTWSRPARAALLPDRWTVWATTMGGQLITATGVGIKPDLAVGPDPALLGIPDVEPQVVDEGMRWMVDFAEAEAVGMGIRVNLGAQDRLATLMVFGLRSGKPADLSAELALHVQALKFARGLDFVRQGTPTNNTDAVRSGWDNGADDDASVEGMLRLLGPVPAGVPDDNTAVTAHALWLPPARFARLPHGRETEQVDAGMMNELLWATTWEYYLTQMIDDGILGAGAVPWLRDHWADYVRGRGPLPTWRVGDQPYGILPVLCGIAQDPHTPEQYLEIVLRTTRSIWDESIPDVTALRLESPDSDRDLVQALATLPHPERFAVRGVVARATLNALAQELSEPWNGWQFTLPGVRAFINQLLLATGASGRPQLLDVIYTDGSREWVAPLITARPLSDTHPLVGNYLNWLSKATPAQLVNETHPFEKNTLLYVLARRSGRLDSGGAATLQRFRSAAKHLAKLPTATLEQLFRETLGTCAYRLDAWETSLATRQLGINRARVEADKLRVGGIQIGGFGWVEDLAARPPLAGPAPVDPANAGFVHAPSLQHATTASVLRSGWRSHGAGPDTPMAVDLSSARARDAWPELLDGVRHGQRLGELLGYRFERGLHEGHPGVELDVYINEFRKLAPLVAGKQPGTEAPRAEPTAQAAPAIVDGLGLLELWRAGAVKLVRLLDTIGAVGSAPRTAAEAELQALAKAVDAVADAAMAEGLHHLLQGNLERAGTITEAVSSGELPPPELEVTSPSRTGRGVTHRIVVVLGTKPPAPSAWPGAGITPRARTEPRLEDWLSSLFGDPQNIVARVGYLPPGGTSPIALRTFHLAELGLAATDAMMLAREESGGAGELGARIEWVLLRNLPVDVPEGSQAWVDAEWSEPQATDQVTLADFLMLARTVRHAVTESRPLRASDLAVPADGIGRSVDLAELLQRSNGVVGELAGALATLEAVADAPPEEAVEPLRDALRAISDLGIAGAFPRSVAGSGAAESAALLAQRTAVAARIRTRLTQAGDDASVAAAVAAATDEQAESLLAARIRAVRGKGFPVLPLFTTPNAPALAATFAKSDELQGGDLFAAAAWLERAAKVQPRAGSFLRAVQLAESLSNQSRLDLQVGQLPWLDGDIWAALPQSPDQAPRDGRLSLIAQKFGLLEFDSPLQGLVLDEFAEVIPRDRQTTGVSFHFDAPGSRAPQAMLLLTVFDTEPGWSEMLIRTAMLNAFEGARRRLADSNALADGGHLLPAIYLETDPQSGQVAGDLGRGLVTDEDSVLVEYERPEIEINIGGAP